MVGLIPEKKYSGNFKILVPLLFLKLVVVGRSSAGQLVGGRTWEGPSLGRTSGPRANERPSFQVARGAIDNFQSRTGPTIALQQSTPKHIATPLLRNHSIGPLHKTCQRRSDPRMATQALRKSWSSAKMSTTRRVRLRASTPPAMHWYRL